MSTRPILGLIYVLQAARELGVDTDAVLAEFGLDADHMDPAAEIDRALELRIVDRLASRLDDPAAGLTVGTAYRLGGYGAFVMLLMTCADAHEALRVGVRYQQLTFLFGELGFEPGEVTSALVLRHAGLPPSSARFRIDGEAAGTLKLMHDLQATLGLDLAPEAVDMPYPRPAEWKRYEAHFRCPVRFGSDAVRFHLRNTWLGIRFPTADPAAHQLYRRQCDELLARRRQADAALAERVLAHLALFREDFPLAGDVARTFGMAERTLRRQLAAEGVSWRQLLDEVRAGKAVELLVGSGQPVERIAQKMGYAETASFIRAFRRWHGVTPAAYRRLRRQG